jgi:hypothetical protein
MQAEAGLDCTEGTDFVRNLFDLVEFRRRQDDVGAFLGQLQRNRSADAAAGFQS